MADQLLACPVCGKAESLTPYPPVAGFLFCWECACAIRTPESVEEVQKGLSVYDLDWVVEHSQNRTSEAVAKSLVKIIDETLRGDMVLDARVLDVGCASGLLVDHLVRTGYIGTAGIDWSEPAIKYADEHRLGSYWVADIAAGLKLKYTFDLVVCSHILEHMAKPQEPVQSLSGLLDPDGYLVIAVPNLGWYKHDSLHRSVSTIFDPEHVIGFSAYGLCQLLERSGFEIDRVVTRTHRLSLLTALGVGVYRRLRKGSGSKGVVQKTYSGITDNRLVSAVLSPLLWPFNKWTERKWGGMELVVVAQKKEKGGNTCE